VRSQQRASSQATPRLSSTREAKPINKRHSTNSIKQLGTWVAQNIEKWKMCSLSLGHYSRLWTSLDGL